jgi:glycosyltransferase involved in cell wall biosynthesis/peptidoglycan/xylan/chitin deacetylase (PgdA/CDA1 family)
MNTKSKYRILMILENGGYPEDSRVMLEANSLRDHGHEVCVICPKSKKFDQTFEVINDVRIYRYPAPWELGGVVGYILEFSYSFMMAWIISFYCFLRFGFDAIHIHMPPDLNGFLGIFYRLLGKKFVMDHHDLSPELFAAQGRSNKVLKKLLYFFEKQSCRWAHRLIATNQSQRTIQIERCGANNHHCFIVRNGPSDFFMESHSPRDYDTPEGTTVFGYVGMMGTQDGVDMLIRALAHLKDELKREDFYVVLLGNGPSLEELKQLTSDLRLDDHVRFTGFVPFEEVPSYVAGMHICTTPDPVNDYNNSCTTIKTMEYMALSRPTVSFDTLENRRTAGDAALYVDSIDDYALFAQALEQMMDDPEMQNRLGRRGRKRIEDGLTWEHQAVELIRLYDSFHSPEITPNVVALSSTPFTENSATVVTASTNAKNVAESPAQKPTHRLEASNGSLQFALGGKAHEVMKKHYLQDAANAKLSSKYRLYYRLRPIIPIWFRHMLQQSHGNSKTDIPADWHIPNSFFQEFTSAIAEDLQNAPDRTSVHPWPNPYRICVSLTHDVETKAGVKLVDRLAKLEESYGFRSCWNFVPYKYKVDQGFIRDLKDRGHEIAVHGYNHDGRLFSSRRMFEKRKQPIKNALSDYGATGFRAPMVHRNLDWIESLGMDYDSSTFDVDPYQAMPGGIGSVWPFIKNGMVEMPYTLPQDHTLFITLGQGDIQTWKTKLQFLRSCFGMGMLVTHPDYLDTESRLGLYEQLLVHLQSNQDDTWMALPEEISAWWRSRSQSKVVDGNRVIGPAADQAQLLPLKELFESLQSNTQLDCGDAASQSRVNQRDLQ